MNSIQDNNQEQVLRENELAFFGAITASVSHELNNVISIIDQTAGLLEDLLIGAETGRQIENDRLKRIADNISNQTQRGVGVIKRLNTFAHSVDDPVKEFDINDLVENLTELTRRFANLKRIQLEMQLYNGSITLISSPFVIQQIMFRCIKHALEISQQRDTVNINVDRSDSNALVTIESPGIDRDEEGFDPVYVELLASRIGGSLNISSEPDRTTFKLSIPFQQ